MTHEYKVGDRVEAFVAGEWSPATVTRSDFSWAHPAHRIMWPSGNEQWISGECLRPLPAAEPAPKPHDPEAIDPEELRLMREVCEAALKLPSDEILTGGAFDKAVYKLALYRTPKHPRCEPPDEFKGERWHWLCREGVYARWYWSFCDNGWRWSRDDVATPLRGAEAVAANGWTYHSVAKPAPVWSDGEIFELYDKIIDREGTTSSNDFIDFAYALLSGEKSLIKGKS